eukprot:SAG11_NODE_28686_length_319_cov_0.554545_1_plen_77_part_10
MFILRPTARVIATYQQAPHVMASELATDIRAQVAGRVVLGEQLAGGIRSAAVVEIDHASARVLLLPSWHVGDASLTG